MKVCTNRDIMKGGVEYTVSMYATTGNFCRMFWGFIGAFWNGSKSVTLTVHQSERPRIVWNGEVVALPDTVLKGEKP